MSALLPTRISDVEAWLRACAGTIPPDGVYPFLFGMATVKLAEAHAEIVRLRAEIAARRAEGECPVCGQVAPLSDVREQGVTFDAPVCGVCRDKAIRDLTEEQADAR